MSDDASEWGHLTRFDVASLLVESERRVNALLADCHAFASYAERLENGDCDE